MNTTLPLFAAVVWVPTLFGDRGGHTVTESTFMSYEKEPTSRGIQLFFLMLNTKHQMKLDDI
jgi:hypothetical protein